ncbi:MULTISPECIES: FixH family protein [Bacillaceae]|uniref:FixH family protein n=1 Tax=Evansella alkalicola TaxID=745819 RepID=A0ABS6JN07_9BACI|nr:MULTISPECIES: FixH family protein [Bacillaceae]MBU9719853.1 FixH family protein [Bacillus alkalicola]
MKTLSLKKSIFALIVTSVLALAACGQGDGDESDSHGANSELNLDPLAVELIMDEEGDPGTEIVIQALVTQGEEKVDDASEVIFEIWEQGQKEESEFIEVEESLGDGVYELVHIFENENIYFVQPHVTARGQHMMPVGEIKIGDAPERLEEDELDDHDHMDHDHHGGEDGEGDGHHHHVEDLTIDWKTGEIIQSENTELAVYIELEGSALTGGDIQFEIWQDGDERHTWLEADETNPGEYTATHTFERTGDYFIEIHVEDDSGLHEHKLMEVSVDHSH